MLIIDGGFCRAYHKETGIAGYTLIYNSYGLSLTAHEPFESTEKAIREEKDIVSRQVAVRYNMKRQLVGDTDQGRQIRQRIRELKGTDRGVPHGSVKRASLNQGFSTAPENGIIKTVCADGNTVRWNRWKEGRNI